ncbi:MAG: NAD-dependent epimerase/dehydratase family protein, partial [Pseudomonadota bacterium]
MARVLVTGADGFLGRRLTLALGARGDGVTALDLAFGDGAPDADARFAGSVTDAAAVRSALRGVDGVIHAAAIADLHAPRGAHDRVNRSGTETVLAAAEEAGARVVQVSSYTTLIGRRTHPGDRVGSTPPLPPNALLGAYPASKRRAEMAVEAAAARGMPALSVLPTAPVGPGDHRPTPPGRMILDLAKGATPALVSTALNLVDVDALCAGILRALDCGRPGQRYLLAGEDVDLGDLARRVAALTGVRPPRFRVPMAVALAAAWAEAGIARWTGHAPAAPLTGVRLAARPVTFDTALAEADLG